MHQTLQIRSLRATDVHNIFHHSNFVRPRGTVDFDKIGYCLFSREHHCTNCTNDPSTAGVNSTQHIHQGIHKNSLGGQREQMQRLLLGGGRRLLFSSCLSSWLMTLVASMNRYVCFMFYRPLIVSRLFWHKARAIITP